MRQWALVLCGFCFTALAAPPVLRVEAHTTQDTGTMRYADRLVVRYGIAELVLATNLAESVQRPFPGPQYPVGDEHVVLLGWSSWGGGMTTLHAMLFHADGDRLALTSSLTLTGDRVDTAFVVRRDGADRVLIGIPQPSETVHEPLDWSLKIGDGSERDIDAIRKLPFVAAQRRTADTVYAPNRTRHGDGEAALPPHVAWITATPDGFAIEERTR
jgi:hypothetical protein